MLKKDYQSTEYAQDVKLVIFSFFIIVLKCLNIKLKDTLYLQKMDVFRV